MCWQQMVYCVFRIHDFHHRVQENLDAFSSRQSHTMTGHSGQRLWANKGRLRGWIPVLDCLKGEVEVSMPDARLQVGLESGLLKRNEVSGGRFEGLKKKETLSCHIPSRPKTRLLRIARFRSSTATFSLPDVVLKTFLRWWVVTMPPIWPPEEEEGWSPARACWNPSAGLHALPDIQNCFWKGKFQGNLAPISEGSICTE